VIGRRAVLLGLGALPAAAQEAGRVYRIAAVQTVPRDLIDRFLPALGSLGFVVGRNLFIEPDGWSLAAGDLDRHARIVAERGADLIWSSGDPSIAAAMRATRTIPIVAISEDLVRAGFADSLAAPGRNLTGISLLSPELDRKRLDFLIDMLDSPRRIGAIAELAGTTPAMLARLEAAAAAHGVALHVEPVARADEVEPALARLKQAGAEGAIQLASSALFGLRRVIVRTARELKLPMMHQFPQTARDGGLVGYGPDLPTLYRAVLPPMMARILRGADPATIPIQQPTSFELVVNLKSARDLGLQPPAEFLARADDLVE
jgi:putative ABC transport system substrate-binding protein